MRDPYEVLGVGRTATRDDIKTAYRRLARTLHPDLNPDDPRAQDQFREVTSAYDLLSDATKRMRFDRGEIDANGQERRRPGSRVRPGAGAGARRTWSFDSIFGDDEGDESFADIFSRARSQGSQQHHPIPKRGADASYRLSISFEEAAAGCTKTVPLANGKRVNVKIPPSTEDAVTLRLKNQGANGRNGGEPGDAMIEVKIKPHPVFRREGNDVIADIPVTLHEAVLGTRIMVPTIDGRVQIAIPEGSNTGTTLRLRGKGLSDPETKARGDQLVKLKIALSEPDDEKLRDFLKKWKPQGTHPRSKIGLE